MRNENLRNFPAVIQPARPYYMPNDNTVGMIESDLGGSYDKDEKINFDSNDDSEIDDGIWSNTKWTN